MDVDRLTELLGMDPIVRRQQPEFRWVEAVRVIRAHTSVQARYDIPGFGGFAGFAGRMMVEAEPRWMAGLAPVITGPFAEVFTVLRDRLDATGEATVAGLGHFRLEEADGRRALVLRADPHPQ